MTVLLLSFAAVETTEVVLHEVSHQNFQPGRWGNVTQFTTKYLKQNT